MILSANEVASLVLRYFPLGGPRKITKTDQINLVATCFEESGFSTLAIGTSPAKRNDGTPNPSYGQQDLGLWQISTRYNYDKLMIPGVFDTLQPVGDWRNPFVNTAIAVEIYNEQGLEAWHAADVLEPRSLQVATMAIDRPIMLVTRTEWGL